MSIRWQVSAAKPTSSPSPPPAEPKHDLDYLTNFERKFRKQGKLINRAAFVKKSS